MMRKMLCTLFGTVALSMPHAQAAFEASQVNRSMQGSNSFLSASQSREHDKHLPVKTTNFNPESIFPGYHKQNLVTQLSAHKSDTHISFSDQSMQNAMAFFYTCQRLQQASGAVFSNDSNAVQNNAMLISGLQHFQQTLQQQLIHDGQLSNQQRDQIEAAHYHIDVMIDGGETLNGYQTEGLRNYLLNEQQITALTV